MIGINIVGNRRMCLDGVDAARKTKQRPGLPGVPRLYRQGVQARILN